MRFALLYQAEVGYDSMMMCLDDEDLFDDWDVHVPQLTPARLARSKAVREGFVNILQHAAITLRENKAPMVANVRAAGTTARGYSAGAFYQAGGTTESALALIFKHARDQDRWVGDGSHMEVFSEDVNALPACRNDHEFGFVALTCGIKI